MKALLAKPGRDPKEVEVENELHTLQQIVGGYIEVRPYVAGSKIICNEEGKLLGLPLNRLYRIYYSAEFPAVMDYICGDFLIVGVDGEEFCSLTDEQIEIIMEEF